MEKHLLPAVLLLALPLCFSNCKSDSEPATPTPTIAKEWNLTLDTKNENPAPAGRSETGTANFKLMSDKSLQYTITVNGLASGDALHNAHFHTGDPITNGPVVLNLTPNFTGGTATGTITGIRQSLIDSLMNDANQLYFNAHTDQFPAGLVRAQLNSANEFSTDVALSGANEVPPVVTTATGLALLRMTADKKLYYKVSVSNLETIDALTAAHIHKATTGVNGDVLVPLAGSATDFDVAKSVTLDDAQFASIKADPLYVNAHSTLHPNGIIRGQIR